MKSHRKILLMFIFIILTLCLSTVCLADSEGNTITYDGITITAPEIAEDEDMCYEDPVYIELSSTPMTLSDDSGESISSIISKYETSGNTAVGIDVSKWQGDIDWASVANSGVKFVMIRCGYRGLESGTIYEDGKFQTYIQGALENGIYVGVYFYSAAVTEAEALEEAEAVVQLIKNYDIKYPVAYDFENFSSEGYRTDGLSADQINANARVFLNYINSQGYTAMLYGSSSPLTSTWASDIRSAYDVWVAHYGVSQPSYTGSYTMWQYTSSGSVSGISGNVDVDIDYSYYMNLNRVDITDYLFDSTYYADRYSDLKALYGYDAAKLKQHYITCGIAEGRCASPAFDAIYYLNKYSDLKAAFGTNYTLAYEHFISIGIHEGRQGNKYFSSTYYLASNSDVKKAYYSSNSWALVHFVTNGLNEGRQGSNEFNVISYSKTQSSYLVSIIGTNYKKYYAMAAGGSAIDTSTTVYLFDSTYYADRYSDLKAVYGYDAAKLKQHYETCGIAEGRSASPAFDPVYYLSKYSDLKAAFGTNYTLAYNHFVSTGIYEGRQGSEFFDVKYYIEEYSDLRNAYGLSLASYCNHFITSGINEGRQGSSSFNVKAYINNYADLKAAFGTNYKSALIHYINCGKKEGRKTI